MGETERVRAAKKDRSGPHVSKRGHEGGSWCGLGCCTCVGMSHLGGERGDRPTGSCEGIERRRGLVLEG